MPKPTARREEGAEEGWEEGGAEGEGEEGTREMGERETEGQGAEGVACMDWRREDVRTCLGVLEESRDWK